MQWRPVSEPTIQACILSSVLVHNVWMLRTLANGGFRTRTITRTITRAITRTRYHHCNGRFRTRHQSYHHALHHCNGGFRILPHLASTLLQFDADVRWCARATCNVDADVRWCARATCNVDDGIAAQADDCWLGSSAVRTCDDANLAVPRSWMGPVCLTTLSHPSYREAARGILLGLLRPPTPPHPPPFYKPPVTSRCGGPIVRCFC